jgi:hypothetical protein
MTVMPVHVYKELGIIRSGGVEVRGLNVRAITQRRNVGKPVLEKYEFTPSVEPAHLDLHSTLRVCTHIALENKPGTHVKVVELHSQGTTPLSPAVALIIADLPLIKASGILSQIVYQWFIGLIHRSCPLNFMCKVLFFYSVKLLDCIIIQLSFADTLNLFNEIYFGLHHLSYG